MSRAQAVALIAVALALGFVIGHKSGQRAAGPAPAAPVASAPASLPRLVDLGSTTCIPCKQMAPILEELKTEYEGRLIVEFIDIYADPASAEKHGIMVIPTQIFLDADGKELFRHEGFFAKDEILAKWKELGVDLGNAP